MAYILAQAKGGSGGGITKVQIPSVVIGSYTYDGTAQGPTITGLDTTHCNVTGTTSATNAGTYTITISLKDPNTMIWNDISVADKVYTWSIGVRSVTVPTVTGMSFTYDGTTQGPTITDLDNDYCTLTGNTTATNAGSYSFTVALNDTVNTKWADDSTTAKSYSWSIAVKAVTVPTVSSTGMIYDGTEQSPTISNPDNAWNTMSGTSSATNAGSYSLTFALVDNVNTEWSDGTTADISLAWTIAKAEQNITLSANSVTLDSDHLTGTVTVSGAMAGLSVSSSDVSVATISLSNGVITISSVNNTTGTATITVTAAETENYNSATATIAVTAAFTPAVNPVLDNNDWATIQAIAQAGTGANYWSVGDRKAVTINGTVGTYTFSSYTAYAYILGFNHNSSKEGTAIHFQFGFNALSGGTHIAFCDSSYGSYNSNQCFNMNPASNSSGLTNSGGWNSCKMRTTLIPAFISALPSALQSALKAITKYTDNTGKSSNVAANVTATSDKVFLLAEYEIFGSRSYANQYEHTDSKQAQYDYYKNGKSKIMYNHTSTGTAVDWWERSPYCYGSTHFCSVDDSGNAGNHTSGRSYGFAPGFAVG